MTRLRVMRRCGDNREVAEPTGHGPARWATASACLLLAALCLLLTAACGSSAAPGTSASSSPGATHSAQASAAKVSLSVTFTGQPGTPAKHWTLRCDPAGGTHPDPAAACGELLKIKDLFASPPMHVNCPMILATGHEVIINGTWFGKKVHRTFTEGGCDLTHWTELNQIFH